MNKAAIKTEKLRKKGFDLVFVAGCEYTIFSKGALPGEALNERISWMITNGGAAPHGQEKSPAMQEASKRLNKILAKICDGVRSHSNRLMTCSS
ncbi:hypothetical protein [Mucilaginibacter sp. R-33]|uniref:hypothetical protein n=1 Tax=Mucilaginibacter sp. R-33 TaxID=3416711 RepID=UPI003CFA340E